MKKLYVYNFSARKIVRVTVEKTMLKKNNAV